MSYNFWNNAVLSHYNKIKQESKRIKSNPEKGIASRDLSQKWAVNSIKPHIRHV